MFRSNQSVSEADLYRAISCKQIRHFVVILMHIADGKLWNGSIFSLLMNMLNRSACLHSPENESRL